MPSCRRDRVHRPPALRKSYPATDARPTTGAFGDGAFDAGTERADVGIGPYGVRSAMVRPTRPCGTGGYKIRPYGPASRPSRRGGLYARPDRLPPGFDDGASEGGYIIRPYSVSKKSVIKREGGCLEMRQPPQRVEKVFSPRCAYFQTFEKV